MGESWAGYACPDFDDVRLISSSMYSSDSSCSVEAKDDCLQQDVELKVSRESVSARVEKEGSKYSRLLFVMLSSLWSCMEGPWWLSPSVGCLSLSVHVAWLLDAKVLSICCLALWMQCVMKSSAFTWKRSICQKRVVCLFD